MHGDEPHRPGVALETHLRGLPHPTAPRGLVGTHARQPLDHALGPEVVLVAGGVEQLAQVEEVGDAPLAVDEGQEPRVHALVAQHGVEGLNEAPFHPAAMPGTEGFQLPLPGFFVASELEQGAAVRAEDRCGEGRTYGRGGAGLRHGTQDPLQLARLGGVEDTVVALNDAHDPVAPQRLLECAGLLVGATQDRDVPGLHGAPRDARIAGEEARDLGGDQVGKVALAPALGDLPLAALLAGFLRDAVSLAAHEEQLEGRLPAVPRARARLRRRAGPPPDEKGIPSSRKGARAPAKSRFTASIRPGSERQLVARVKLLLRRVRLGVEIGEDVGTPEAVDGLLGVADEEERETFHGRMLIRSATLRPPDPAEDLVLDRVRVLELVDERGAVASADLRRQAALRAAPSSASPMRCRRSSKDWVPLRSRGARAAAAARKTTRSSWSCSKPYIEAGPAGSRSASMQARAQASKKSMLGSLLALARTPLRALRG